MRTNRMLAVVALALVCAAPALAQWTSTRTTTTYRTTRAAPAFAIQVAQGGIAEVELSRIAADRTRDNDVREFAERMILDHSRANEDLEEIARSRGWRLPQNMDAAHRQTARRLYRMYGGQLDREYMMVMLNDHNTMVARVRSYARNGSDRDLRLFARRVLPDLEHHRDMARDVRRGVHPASSY